MFGLNILLFYMLYAVRVIFYRVGGYRLFGQWNQKLQIDNTGYKIQQIQIRNKMQQSTNFHQSKSSFSRLAQVQQFISYKLANPLRSQEEARAMRLKTKYQKQLDRQYKRVDEKMKQLKAQEYECKKIKKYVWDMLVRYSAANDETDQQTNKWKQRMLSVEEAKQSRARKTKEEKMRLRMQQEELQRRMEETTKESQSELQKLKQTVQSLIQQIESATMQCIQIQPQITKHNLQNQYLQTLHQQTLTYQSQIEQFKQNISKSKQFLSVLQNKIYQQFQAKQEDDANRENQCRTRIQAMVVHLDDILSKDGEGDWQTIWDKYMPNVKDARDLEKDQKYREVRDKVVGKQTAKNDNLHIKQKISEKYQISMKEMKEQQEEARKQEERLQKICIKLQEQENSKDKQIKNLSQTIDKISFNLNK